MRVSGLAVRAHRHGAATSSAHQGPRPYRRALRLFLCRRSRQGHGQARSRALDVRHGRGRVPRRAHRGVLLAHPPDRHHRRPPARAAGSGREPGGRPTAPLRHRAPVVLRPGRAGRDPQRGACVAAARGAGGRGGGRRSCAPEPSLPRAPGRSARRDTGGGGCAQPVGDRRPAPSQPGAGRLPRIGAAARPEAADRGRGAARRRTSGAGAQAPRPAGPRRAHVAAAASGDGHRGRVLRGLAAGGLVAAARAGPGAQAGRDANLACAQPLAGRRRGADVPGRPRPGLARPGPGRHQRARLRASTAARGPAHDRPLRVARPVGERGQARRRGDRGHPRLHAPARGPRGASVGRSRARPGQRLHRVQHADPGRRQLLALRAAGAALLRQPWRERDRRPRLQRPGRRHRPQPGADGAAAR